MLPFRGLWQGDPISSYLFLLCAKGLSTLIATWESEGKIQGVTICPCAPIVNHLLFTDDSLFFCRANRVECIQISKILNSYECAMGEKVNLIKSEICFSQNIKRPMQSKLADMLGVQRVDRHVMYLGMPTLMGRNKSQCFAYIKERFWKRLQSLKGKVLSAARKELLIKTMALTIPIYMMNYFILPKYFCDDLNHLIASFWWNEYNGGKMIH